MGNQVIETFFFRRAKWLLHLLIVSLILNGSLIATFIYLGFTKRQERLLKASVKKSTHADRKKGVDHHSLLSVVNQCVELSREQLMDLLRYDEHLVEGCSRASIALSILTARHYFNLGKALEDEEIETFDLNLESDKKVLPLLIGMDKRKMVAVQTYVQKVRWPVTTQGLFEIWKNNEGPDVEESLKEALFLSKEMQLVKFILGSYGITVPFESVLLALKQNAWEDFSSAVHQLETEREWIEEGGFPLLHLLSSGGCETVTNFLIEHMSQMILKYYDNEQLITLIQAPSFKRLNHAKFIHALKESKRPKIIKDLVQISQEECRQVLTVKEEMVKYRIKSGDTLWHIARHFNTDIASIKRSNNLSEDHIRPGTVIKIPHKSSGKGS